MTLAVNGKSVTVRLSEILVLLPDYRRYRCYCQTIRGTGVTATLSEIKVLLPDYRRYWCYCHWLLKQETKHLSDAWQGTAFGERIGRPTDSVSGSWRENPGDAG